MNICVVTYVVTYLKYTKTEWKSQGDVLKHIVTYHLCLKQTLVKFNELVIESYSLDKEAGCGGIIIVKQMTSKMRSASFALWEDCFDMCLPFCHHTREDLWQSPQLLIRRVFFLFFFF